MPRTGFRLIAMLSLIAAGLLAAPRPAAAWRHYHHWHWYGGFYMAPPVVVPPPVYVAPPPVYVAPPPVYAPPPALSPYAPERYAGPPGPAAQCIAGPYVCPLGAPTSVGQSCACDTPQGRFWGETR